MVLKTIAVTGASGMLGRHVVAALGLAGFNVVSFSRAAGDSESWRRWDLMEWKTDGELDELFVSVDAVIHAGATVPNAQSLCDDDKLFDANVRATFNLANWARKRGLPLVYVSGAIVYANSDDRDVREDAPLGLSGFGGFYGLTKLLAEDILRREKDAGLRLAIIRPSSIYGHGLSVEKLICSFLNRASEGEVIELSEPVADRVDLIHAADVADAVVKVLQNDAWDTFNLASGCDISIIDLAKTCISVVGKGCISVKKNQKVSRPPIRRFDLNCRSAEMRLGWSAQVSHAVGVRAVFEQKVIVVGQV